MSREGRTYTNHFHLETRQHELLGLDLGEGVPRRALVLGVALALAWIALLWPILGTPNKVTFSVYMLPPLFVAAYGMQTSTRVPSRRRITDWLLRLRYVYRGHRPIIRLGARAAHRSEFLPWRARVGEGSYDSAVRFLFPWLDDEPTASPAERPADPPDQPAGPPVRLLQRSRLLDQEQMYRAWQRTYRRRRGRSAGTPSTEVS